MPLPSSRAFGPDFSQALGFQLLDLGRSHAGGTATAYRRRMNGKGYSVIALMAGIVLLGMAAPAPAAEPAQIAANDNTVGAGRLDRGVLHIALVARRGLWYPDGPGTIGLPIEAFGESGKPLSIPGPLLRVPIGTRVVATVRNELSHDLTVRGLASPGESQTPAMLVRRGAVGSVSFVLNRAGIFGYYGSDKGETIDDRIFDDAELAGAIVVEAPGAPPIDHVFVLGLYAPVKMKDGSPNFLYFLETINGRSFPATERLAYRRGNVVRWAVYNASPMIHPMHLHGFYFKVDRPGAYDEVTHRFHPGDAAVLSWTADRPGNWMFHCHIDDHITRHAPLRDMRAGKADPKLTVAKRFHQPNEPMGGMVIAFEVLPRPGDNTPVERTAYRRLTLEMDARNVAHPTYEGLTKGSLRLSDGNAVAVSTGNLGPPIVLTQNRPVAITVLNRTFEETSMHWHGIALQDSYYDGGAGMGMAMKGYRMSPPIEPGASFEARFTPPDAGTFMYHAHMDDGWQLGSGLVGPFIVLPAGEQFDPTTDHIVMISESYEKAGSPLVAIGGVLTPPPLTMTAGVPQRLRFIELSLSGENLVVSLSDGSRVLVWTPIAKDGRDLPAALQLPEVATRGLSVGETRDFRFTPQKAGTLTLTVYDLDNNDILVGSQRIVVTGSERRGADGRRLSK
jgi:FtsP/CotA-like multicopper oxidase with cupredoxin domain